MQVRCANCRQEVDADNLNLDRLIAKCDNCSSVFSFARQIPAAQRPAEAAEPKQVAMPGNVEVDYEGADLVMRIKPYRPGIFVLFMVPLLLVPVIFGLIWNRLGTFDDFQSSDELGAFYMVFITISVLFGLVLLFVIYVALTRAINSTVIRAGPDLLQTSRGPLPSGGNLQITSNDLDQLYCSEDMVRGPNRTSYLVYAVNAILQGGKKVSILRNLRDKDQALFVEQAVEKHLGIMDRAVAGEIK